MCFLLVWENKLITAVGGIFCMRVSSRYRQEIVHQIWVQLTWLVIFIITDKHKWSISHIENRKAIKSTKLHTNKYAMYKI